MKKFLILLGLSVAFGSHLWGENTKERRWESAQGSKLKGVVTDFRNGVATSVGSKNGKKLTLKLEQFSPKDQAFLREHFKEQIAEEEKKATEVGHRGV